MNISINNKGGKMNPTVDNDLQKAIDDITNNTNTDPVFGDPVAAPAPAPKAPAPKPVTPAPRPAKPAAPKAPLPDLGTPAAPAPSMAMPPMPGPVVKEETFTSETISAPVSASADMRDVKEAALRDLAPLVSTLDVDASKKFKLYRNIREELHDDSVIAPAYESAKEIADDHERGEALLYLVESIDNM